jgi:hypothetical protein
LARRNEPFAFHRNHKQKLIRILRGKGSGWRWIDLPLDLRDFAGAAGNLDVVEVLQVEPKLGVVVEITRQTQSGLCGNPPTPMHNFSNASCWNMELERELVDGQMKRFHEIFAKDFAGVDRGHESFVFFHVSKLSLVIIHDFNSVTMAVTPDKTDAPLLVATNRVLAFAASF